MGTKKSSPLKYSITNVKLQLNKRKKVHNYPTHNKQKNIYICQHQKYSVSYFFSLLFLLNVFIITHQKYIYRFKLGTLIFFSIRLLDLSLTLSPSPPTSNLVFKTNKNVKQEYCDYRY